MRKFLFGSSHFAITVQWRTVEFPVCRVSDGPRCGKGAVAYKVEKPGSYQSGYPESMTGVGVAQASGRG